MSLLKARYLLASVLLVGCALPAASQNMETAQKLSAATGQIAINVLAQQSPYQFEFVDLQAFDDAGTALNTPAGARRLAFGWNIDGIQAFGSTDDATWESNFGAPRAEIRWVAGSGIAPDVTTLWGLKDGQAREQLVAGLSDRGFAQTSQSSDKILGNGEAGGFDLQKNDPKNPWRGAMGAARFVMPLDVAVVGAPNPALLTPFGMKETQKLNEYAPMQAILDAINEQDGTLMQAAIISPVFGMQATDLPADFFTGKPEDILKAWQSSTKSEADSLPLYHAGAIADLQYNSKPALLIALAFADCEAADSAVKVVSERWKTSELATLAEELKTSTVKASDGVCVSIFQTASSGSEAVGNPLATAINNAVVSRSFDLLAIGANPN